MFTRCSDARDAMRKPSSRYSPSGLFPIILMMAICFVMQARRT